MPKMNLDQMTFADKSAAMERLWEDLGRISKAVPSPSWHGDGSVGEVNTHQRGQVRIRPAGWSQAEDQESRSMTRGQVITGSVPGFLYMHKYNIVVRITTHMKCRIVYITLVSLLFVLLFPNLTLADKKSFIKEYNYQAGDEDSKNSSRTIAIREVKKLLLEEMGTYLESVTEVKDLQLTKDQIITLTAGIIHTEILAEKWNGKTYWLKANIVANTDNLIESINKLRKDRGKVKELEDLRRQSDDLLKENEKLRKELSKAEVKGREKTVTAYKMTIDKLSAKEWLENGQNFYESKDYKNAISSFTKAIELYPEFAWAYISRGLAYGHVGNKHKAMQDYDKAIELDTPNAYFYFARGLAYTEINHTLAIRDYEKAIEFDPKYAKAYSALGDECVDIGIINQAIRYYDIAIKLEPQDALSYASRGSAYRKMGKYNQAIQDYDRSIELDSRDAADVYILRSFAHSKIGNHNQALLDMKTAARLGSKVAEDTLRKIGIE